MSKIVTFNDIVIKKEGLRRGPFGGDLKKEIFVEKTSSTYKVYEQGNVLNNDMSLGRYYITSEYFNNNMSRFEVLEGDYLISCSGVNYGAISYVDAADYEKGIINQALLRVRLNLNIIDPEYFYFLYNSYIVNIITSGNGDSTIPNFPPLSVIKEIRFPLPDLKTQKEAIKKLSKLKQYISVNEKQVNLMKKIINLTYSRWFEDYRYPGNEINGFKSKYSSYINDNTPKTWKQTFLFSNEIKKANKSIENFDGELIYLDTSSVENDVIIDRSNYVDYNNKPSRANLQMEENTIWFAKMQDTIKHIFAFENRKTYFKDYVISTGFSGLKPKNNEYVYYLACYINSRFFESSKDYKSSGTTQKAINDLNTGLIPIVLPDTKLINKFNNIVKPLFDNIYLLEEETYYFKEILEYGASKTFKRILKN
jgi:type I restriction enzyme S subunit